MKLRVMLGGNQDLWDRLDAAPVDPLEADRDLLRGLETRIVFRGYGPVHVGRRCRSWQWAMREHANDD